MILNNRTTGGQKAKIIPKAPERHEKRICRTDKEENQKRILGLTH